MKYYFTIVISVLVVIIFSLFFVLFKIYKLHAKSQQDVRELVEQQELLSSKASSLHSSFDAPFLAFENNSSENNSVQGKQEIDVNIVQPDVKDLPISENEYVAKSNETINEMQNIPISIKKKQQIKMLLQYEKQKSMLKFIVRHLDTRAKSKTGSSETYVDIQISPYRFRTYRNPGYRRPVRAVIKKTIEFRLDMMELRSTYLLVFLLRYDPFSRLRVDGEVVIKMADLLSDAFKDGCQVEEAREFVQSKQEFTAFIFRPTQ